VYQRKVDHPILFSLPLMYWLYIHHANKDYVGVMMPHIRLGEILSSTLRKQSQNCLIHEPHLAEPELWSSTWGFTKLQITHLQLVKLLNKSLITIHWQCMLKLVTLFSKISTQNLHSKIWLMSVKNLTLSVQSN